MARSKKSASSKSGAPKATTLAAFLNSVKATHANAAPAGKGACLLKDPKTGEAICVRTSEDACKALKGTFVGGIC